MTLISRRIEELLKKEVYVTQDGKTSHFNLSSLVNRVKQLGKFYFQGGVLRHLLKGQSYKDIDCHIICETIHLGVLGSVVKDFTPVELRLFSSKTSRGNEFAWYGLGSVDLFFIKRGFPFRSFVSLEDLLLCDLEGNFSIKQTDQKFIEPLSIESLKIESLKEDLINSLWTVPNPSEVRDLLAIVPRRMADPDRIFINFEQVQEAVNTSNKNEIIKSLEGHIDRHKSQECPYLWRICYLFNLNYIADAEKRALLAPLFEEIKEISIDWFKKRNATFYFKKEGAREFLEIVIPVKNSEKLRFWAHCQDFSSIAKPLKRQWLIAKIKEKSLEAYEEFIKLDEKLTQGEVCGLMKSQLGQKVVQLKGSLQEKWSASALLNDVDFFKEAIKGEIPKGFSAIFFKLTQENQKVIFEKLSEIGKEDLIQNPPDYLMKKPSFEDIIKNIKASNAEEKKAIRALYSTSSEEHRRLLTDCLAEKNLILTVYEGQKLPIGLAKALLEGSHPKKLIAAIRSDLTEKEILPYYEKKEALSAKELESYLQRFEKLPKSLEEKAWLLRDQLSKFRSFFLHPQCESRWIDWAFEELERASCYATRMHELFKEGRAPSVKSLLNAIQVFKSNQTIHGSEELVDYFFESLVKLKDNLKGKQLIASTQELIKIFDAKLKRSQKLTLSMIKAYENFSKLINSISVDSLSSESFLNGLILVKKIKNASQKKEVDEVKLLLKQLDDLIFVEQRSIFTKNEKTLHVFLNFFTCKILIGKKDYTLNIKRIIDFLKEVYANETLVIENAEGQKSLSMFLDEIPFVIDSIHAESIESISLNDLTELCNITLREILNRLNIPSIEKYSPISHLANILILPYLCASNKKNSELEGSRFKEYSTLFMETLKSIEIGKKVNFVCADLLIKTGFFIASIQNKGERAREFAQELLDAGYFNIAHNFINHCLKSSKTPLSLKSSKTSLSEILDENLNTAKIMFYILSKGVGVDSEGVVNRVISKTFDLLKKLESLKNRSTNELLSDLETLETLKSMYPKFREELLSFESFIQKDKKT